MIDDPTTIAVVVGLSVGVFVLALIAVPVVIIRLPEDYFTRPPKNKRNPVWVVAKNILGVALVVLGIAMLVLPGQGVLTVIAGISLVDFPGRRKLEHRLLKQRQVKRVIAAIRRKAGKPPLQLDDADAQHQTPQPTKA